MTVYFPDTPPDRALIRAVSQGDVGGVRQALNEGASPNAAHGEGTHPTCSALLKATMFKGPQAPEMVKVLLAAGAPVVGITHGVGRKPLWEALRLANPSVVQAFVDHCGGREGFFQVLHDEGAVSTALAYAIGPALANPQLSTLFFQLWDWLPEGKTPKTGEEGNGILWPWCLMDKVRTIPDEVFEQANERIPMPTPHAVGQETWNAWVFRQARLSSPPPALLRRCLAMTPDAWWLARPTLDAENIIRPPVLLESIASQNCLVSLRAGLAALHRIPMGWNHPDAPSPDAMLIACAHRAASVRLMFKVAPKPLSGRAMSLALIRALSEDYDPHHRIATARFLLEKGADPRFRGQGGDTALHVIAKWGEGKRRRLEEGVQLLIQAGARWEGPRNSDGKTPWMVLEECHPALAARFLEEIMEGTIPSVSSDSHPPPPSFQRF